MLTSDMIWQIVLAVIGIYAFVFYVLPIMFVVGIFVLSMLAIGVGDWYDGKRRSGK